MKNAGVSPPEKIYRMEMKDNRLRLYYAGFCDILSPEISLARRANTAQVTSL